MMNKWMCLGLWIMMMWIGGCSSPPREQTKWIEPTYSHQRDAPAAQPADATATPHRRSFSTAHSTPLD